MMSLLGDLCKAAVYLAIAWSLIGWPLLLAAILLGALVMMMTQAQEGGQR